MTHYKLYLNEESVVEASITERPERTHQYIGTVEVQVQDLADLLDWMQMAVDATIIQLSIKATNISTKRNKSELN